MNFTSDTIEALIDKEELRFKVGEGDIEFKQEFNIDKLYKAMAGMTNSHGGLIVFGVNDNRFVIGLKDTTIIPDSSQISQFCTSHFSENIRFERCDFEIEGKAIVAFYIHLRTTPLLTVCTKDAKGIHDGDIYIRLSGATEKMKGHALSLYLHKIYQKDDGDISKLQKKSLIAQHAPKIRNGHGSMTAGQQIQLFVQNEGADAIITNLSTTSEEINIDFKKPISIPRGSNINIPLFNKTMKIAANLRFEFLIEYKDQLDNIYQQHVNCNGAGMTFLFPELKTNR